MLTGISYSPEINSATALFYPHHAAGDTRGEPCSMHSVDYCGIECLSTGHIVTHDFTRHPFIRKIGSRKLFHPLFVERWPCREFFACRTLFCSGLATRFRNRRRRGRRISIGRLKRRIPS